MLTRTIHVFRRQSNNEKYVNINNEHEQPGLPHILEVLDKVDHVPVHDERKGYF